MEMAVATATFVVHLTLVASSWAFGQNRRQTNMSAKLEPHSSAAREGYVSLPGAELYYRVIGRGHPILILHGGPDFDHTYLLPEMDRLSESFRLIYYDQRGRGR